jgi:uncharacterized protein (TIGR03437 family)
MKVWLKRSCIVLALLACAATVWWQQGSMASSTKNRQGAPTFNKEIVRLMQKHCQSCHHPGDIAPFSLLTYKDARPWARAIREQVLTKEMPPWKPLEGCGDFKDARDMTQDEINIFAMWVDAGAPEGNASDLPAPIQFTEGWPLGKPDFIAPIEPYTPPVGKDTYRCFSVPTAALRGDRWTQGLDVQPGNRKIVHHVIAYADPQGRSVALDQRDAGPGYNCFGGPGFNISLTQQDILEGNSIMLGGWAPGARGYFAPEGLGMKLPSSPTARVVLQVHYHPTGQPESDNTSVGFYFAQTPVAQPMLPMLILNQSFAIPAGAKNYPVTASFTVPLGLTGSLVGITPHMHLLGQTIKVTATTDNGQQQCLVNIPKWDFNWQGSYLYKQPIPFGANTKLDLACTFDNSMDNPYQPNNPPKIVRWGEETTDEMALAFLAFTLDLVRVTPSAPVLTDAVINDKGQLLVTGTGFRNGADIEINGQRLNDTQAQNAAALFSQHVWKAALAPGQTASVTVINPDGIRTSAQTVMRTGMARSAATVSAASYATLLAPDSIAAVFGEALATSTAAATTNPLPTELAGTSLRINGVVAPLFFASRGQINFLIPPEILPGPAVIEITASDGTLSRGTLNVSNTAPSIFTVNASGTGTPAAVVTADGVNFKPVVNPDGSPVELNGGEFLVLFGTGFRRASAEVASMTIGGRSAFVLYAGAQGGLVGLDQLNVELPQGVSGLLDVALTINGKPANIVKIRLK